MSDRLPASDAFQPLVWCHTHQQTPQACTRSAVEALGVTSWPTCRWITEDERVVQQ